jgi:hypothetical protein
MKSTWSCGSSDKMRCRGRACLIPGVSTFSGSAGFQPAEIGRKAGWKPALPSLPRLRRQLQQECRNSRARACPALTRGRRAVPPRERLISDGRRWNSIRRHESHPPCRRLRRPRHLRRRQPYCRLHSWARHPWCRFPWVRCRLSRGRPMLFPQPATLRTNSNQAERTSGGTNRSRGFVEWPQVRPLAQFPTRAQRRAIPKPQEKSGAGGENGRSSPQWTPKVCEGRSRIALTPHHIQFRTAVRAPRAGRNLQPSACSRRDWSLPPRLEQRLLAPCL